MLVIYLKLLYKDIQFELLIINITVKTVLSQYYYVYIDQPKQLIQKFKLLKVQKKNSLNLIKNFLFLQIIMFVLLSAKYYFNNHKCNLLLP